MNLDIFKQNGKFLMLALDHRSSFKKLISPENPDNVADEEVVSLKAKIINALKDQFSALLIDESFGLDAYPKHEKPFLLPLEKSGYLQQGEMITELEYSTVQLKQMGAAGAKLLLYFNPSVESAVKQIDTAKKVVEECKQNNFPLFLEPVTYNDGITHTQQSQLVLEMVKTLLASGIIPDVFKLEYPGNQKTCEQVTQLLGNTPWILLTNPDSFEEFKAHLKDAISSGAQGFLAGRALWQEACKLRGEEKDEFIQKTLPERFKEISQIVLTS